MMGVIGKLVVSIAAGTMPVTVMAVMSDVRLTVSLLRVDVGIPTFRLILSKRKKIGPLTMK